MKKTKVLIDTYQLRIARTGIRKYVEELITLCNEHGSSTFEYFFYPDSSIKESYDTAENASFLSRLKEQWRYFYYKQIELPRIVKNESVDLLFIPDYYAPSISLKAHKMVVFHDAFFWETPEHYGKLWWAYFRRMILTGLRGRSSVLTISKHSKSTLKKVLPTEIPIDVLYNANRKEGSADSVILQRLKVKKNQFFLHVGVFEERKNLDLLVEAFALFRERRQDSEIKLILVGAAPTGRTKSALPDLLMKVKMLGIEKHVIFPGYLTDAEISALYESALTYVFPSSNEGFGYPILEAFAHQCPVLISDQPALKEIAAHGALRFPMNSSESLCSRMIDVYENASLREDLIEKGAKRLTDFDRAAYMKKLEKLMASYLSQNNG